MQEGNNVLCLRLVLLKTKQSSVVYPPLKYLSTFPHRARAPSPVVEENAHLSSRDASQDALYRSGHHQVHNSWRQAVTLRHRAFHKLRLREHFAIPRQEASLTAHKAWTACTSFDGNPCQAKVLPGETKSRSITPTSTSCLARMELAVQPVVHCILIHVGGNVCAPEHREH